MRLEGFGMADDGLGAEAEGARKVGGMIPQEPTALRERAVLAWLRIAGSAGACVSDFPETVAYSARNAVSRLRRAGYVIEGRTCRVHGHGRAHIERYWLVRP